MNIVQLSHRRGLGYPGARVLPALADSDLDLASSWPFYTFRAHARHRPRHRQAGVSALTRLTWPAGANDVVLYALESDSPLAHILMWDLAHDAPVGARLHVVEPAMGARHRYFDRAYYRQAMPMRYQHGDIRVYEKHAPLDAQAGDLDHWTFGIPVGPEDATLLNACVARILELDVPHKEILLCGRPADNFRYWDQVRIVGEDITAPPVQICRKKNRLAQEARFDNLCLIHDRVFLPLNFHAAVRRYGNAFSLLALQSLYFDDRGNFVPRRYSDFNRALRAVPHAAEGLARASEPQPIRYAAAVFGRIESQGFVYGHPYRYSEQHYPTGSLYLVKKAVWKRVPQDERLTWIEFEDIEQGQRAAAQGIPSRVNPYGLTQSMLSRPIVSLIGGVACERRGGGVGVLRHPGNSFGWVAHKPLVRKTLAQAMVDMQTFMGRWGVDASGLEPVSGAAMHTRRRLRWIAQALGLVRLPLQRDVVQRFLKDFEKLILGDQASYGWHQQASDRFSQGGANGLSLLLDQSAELFNQVAQRPARHCFAHSLLDYLPRGQASTWLGNLCSALWLGWVHHRYLVIPGGLWGRFRALRDSTPYRRYATEQMKACGVLHTRQDAP